jgi:hypothetical protein
MKAYGRREVLLHVLTSALNEGALSASVPDSFTAGKKSHPARIECETRWVPDLVCTLWRESKYFTLSGIRPTIHLLYSPSTTLPWLVLETCHSIEHAVTGHDITEAYFAYQGKTLHFRIWFGISIDEKDVLINSSNRCIEICRIISNVCKPIGKESASVFVFGSQYSLETKDISLKLWREY